VGEVVQIQAGGEDHVGLYRGRVRAIGLRRILLDVDDPMPTRTPLTLMYARGDALYRFATRSIGPAKAGSLTVTFPRQIVRLQRRQYYRLPLEAPTTFRLLGTDGRVNSGPVPARLVNLSGGGALLSVAKPLPAGVEVSLRVPSGKTGEAIPVDAETLDCHVASQGLAHIYLVRLRFFPPPRLPEEDREEIVAYIFEQQRLMLRTRKLLRA
jgi:c-di-GMP-binding flagellar brake protein YcgR